jgi:hypothetical protein
LISESLTVSVTLGRVAVGITVGVRVGPNVAVRVGDGVMVGSGAVKEHPASKIKISPISRTRRFMISSFGNKRRSY